MAYQNNNSRITPEAKEDRTLKPAATPTNKMINYNPAYGSEDAIVWKNNAAALASIGKGMVDMDFLWKRQSEENAIKAAYITEQQGGNKHEWKEVSKNIQGAAKFNPYNDDAFRQLKATDIMRAGYYEFLTTPDLEKMDAEKYYQLQQDKTKQIVTAFKEAGLSPKDYGDTLVQWNKSLGVAEANYTTKNAEYRFKQTQTKMASDMSFEFETVLMENPDMDKSVLFKSVIDNKITQMTELGWAEDTQMGVLFAAAKGFLAKNADMISGAEFKAAISDITINGKKASEIIPNFDVEAKNIYKEAQKAIYDDKKFAYDNHKLEIQMSADNAMADLYKWMKSNPNADMPTTLAQVQSVVQKYNLEEVGFSFMSDMSRNKNVMLDYQEVKSDPRVLQELGAKAALGELTGEDINTAIVNKQLNYKEGLAFVDRINREAKADVNAVKTSYTALNTKLGSNGYYGKTLGKDSADIKEIQGYANQTINDLNAGNISTEEAQKRIQDLERIATAKASMRQNKATNDSFLLNANYIKSQQTPSYNRDLAIKAFNNLRLERGKMGQSIKPQITSAPNSNRVINGKTSPHKGYDLGASPETRIHSVNMKGVCIYAGYLNDFGNYAVIKYDNGSYMRVGHLSTPTKHLQGKVIPAGYYIGNAGNTGFSTGTHLHVDFWDKNRQLISVERFQKGIR